MPNGSQTLDAEGIKRALTRISHEILERHNNVNDIVFVGIRTRGVFLAERLQKNVNKIEGSEVPLGILDITLYRDDLSEIGFHPELKETNIPFDLTDKVVVLIDDVLYTGRTIRSAMNALADFGRPQAIELAVLVDRGHRELPIKADYVGKNIPTSKEETVIVSLTEEDSEDSVKVNLGGRDE